MVGRILLVNLGLLAGFMSLAFLVAKSRNRFDTVDTCWGLGFILAAWSVELQQPSKRSLLVAVLVSVWGFRLASHIYRRSQKKGDDPRYQEIVSKWQGNIWPRAYVSIFLVQAALIWIVSLPIVMISNYEISGLRWLIWLGALGWLAGFAIEVISDRQLRNFLKMKDRPKVLQTGLWRYSRHPNYAGELKLWWGIGIIGLADSWGWLGLIGPLTISYLIIFVSGIPPIERRRAKEPDYQAYKRRTSPLLLLPPRK